MPTHVEIATFAARMRSRGAAAATAVAAERHCDEQKTPLHLLDLHLHRIDQLTQVMSRSSTNTKFGHW